MDNPLTLEEKVRVPNLIGHDLAEKQSIIVKQAYMGAIAQQGHGRGGLDPSIINGLSNIVKTTFVSVYVLTQYTDPFFLRATTPSDIRFMLDDLSRNYPGVRIVPTVDSQVSTTFNSEINLLYSILHNLIKNSQRLVDPKKGEIYVSATEFFGRAEHLVYRCPETPIARGFIRFDVHDNGPGFPADRPLAEFLQLGATSREEGHGFGLYYVSLVAKVLRSHIGIDSKPGDTNISFYHPLNLE